MDRIITLNQKGIIPGPHETEEQFLLRAEYCLTLKTRIAEELKEAIPFSEQKQHSEGVLEGLERAKNLYGIEPDWVPIFFSNHKLAPWHGGCAWIFQRDEEAPTSAFLQLRRSIFYSPAEMIAHELCHVGRMMFEEPKFEEMFAYQTSISRFRRYFGPLVQSSWESLAFVGLLFTILSLDLYLLFFGYEGAYQDLMGLKMIPLGLLLLGVFRLTIRHRQLKSCRESLKNLIALPEKVDEILFRMTDQEIQTRSFLKDCTSFRWKVLKKIYFK